MTYFVHDTWPCKTVCDIFTPKKIFFVVGFKTPSRKYNKEENISCVVTHVYAFVFRIDRKKDKTERKILDSQERAFWDVHRPVVKLFLNDEAFQVLTGKF